MNPADQASNQPSVIHDSEQSEVTVAVFDQSNHLHPDPTTEKYSHIIGALSNFQKDKDSITADDLAANPELNTPEAYHVRGLIFRDAGQIEAALMHYDKAIELGLEIPDIHYDRGFALLQIGETEAAIGEFDECIRLDSGFTKGYLGKGEALARLGHNEAAIVAFDEAIALEPDNVEAYHGKGLALDELGQIEAAIDVYDYVIAIQPDLAYVYFNKGLAYSKLGQVQASLDAYDQAIELGFENPDLFICKGYALDLLGHKDAALMCYEEAIRINPEHEKAYLNKGLVLFHSGDEEGAISAFDKAIQLKPDNAQAYYVIGLALSSVDQIESALIAFEKEIQLDPDFGEAYNRKGLCLMELGRMEDALAEFDIAIELDANSEYAYGNKGFALYKLGAKEEAISWFDKQIEVNPESWLSYAEKGLALYDMGRAQEAMECFEVVVRTINEGKLEGKRFTSNRNALMYLMRSEVEVIDAVRELYNPDVVQMSQINLDEPRQASNDILSVNEIVFSNQEQEQPKQKIPLVDEIVIPKYEKEQPKQTVPRIEEIAIPKYEKEQPKQMATHLDEIVMPNYEKEQPRQKEVEQPPSELAELKKSLETLEDRDSEVSDYCRIFYWTTMNLFSAYRVVSIGQIKGSFEEEGSGKDGILAKNVEKGSKKVGELVNGKALLGREIQLMDNIVDSIYTTGTKETRFVSKGNAINKTIQSKVSSEEDISIGVLKAAMAITHARDKMILFPEIKSPSKIDTKAGSKWLDGKVNDIKSKITPSIKLKDQEGYAAGLGLKDSILFVTYLLKNSESLIKRKETLDQQIETIIKYGGLEQLLENVKGGRQTSCCAMF